MPGSSAFEDAVWTAERLFSPDGLQGRAEAAERAAFVGRGLLFSTSPPRCSDDAPLADAGVPVSPGSLRKPPRKPGPCRPRGVCSPGGGRLVAALLESGHFLPAEGRLSVSGRPVIEREWEPAVFAAVKRSLSDAVSALSVGSGLVSFLSSAGGARAVLELLTAGLEFWRAAAAPLHSASVFSKRPHGSVAFLDSDTLPASAWLLAGGAGLLKEDVSTGKRVLVRRSSQGGAEYVGGVTPVGGAKPVGGAEPEWDSSANAVPLAAAGAKQCECLLSEEALAYGAA